MEHFAAGRPVVLAEEAATDGAEDDELSATIRELIDTRVRPAVAQDGGDIIFRGFEDGVVYLHMQGACSGCPSRSEEHTSELQSLMRISYAVFCLKKKTNKQKHITTTPNSPENVTLEYLHEKMTLTQSIY